MTDLSREGATAAYLDELTEVLATLPRDDIATMIEHLELAREARARVFIIGNGGSAATASHMAVDLGKTVSVHADRATSGFDVVALTDNVPWITAVGNDIGYDAVFSEQLRNLAKPGDVLIAITGSGNSRNIVEAVDLAKKLGMTAIGLLGFDGGAVRTLVDVAVLVDSDDYGLIEDCHLALNHLVTSYFKERMAPGSGV